MRQNTRLAWFAGMIDADGCITLNKGQSSRNVFYTPNLHVTNCHMGALRVCRELAGEGSIFICEEPKKPTHRQKLRWQISGPGAKRVLKRVMRYMVIKKEQAALAIEAQGLNKRGRPNPNLARLEAIRLELQALKRV